MLRIPHRVRAGAGPKSCLGIPLARRGLSHQLQPVAATEPWLLKHSGEALPGLPARLHCCLQIGRNAPDITCQKGTGRRPPTVFCLASMVAGAFLVPRLHLPMRSQQGEEPRAPGRSRGAARFSPGSAHLGPDCCCKLISDALTASWTRQAGIHIFLMSARRSCPNQPILPPRRRYRHLLSPSSHHMMHLLNDPALASYCVLLDSRVHPSAVRP